MPMNGDTLGDLILSMIGGTTEGPEGAARREGFRKLGQAIVLHIQTNAQISGVATGLATTGPVIPVAGTLVMPPGSIQ